jgi:hypothetical protein
VARTDLLASVGVVGGGRGMSKDVRAERHIFDTKGESSQQ